MKHSEYKYRKVKLNPIAASLLLLMPVMAQAADISIINGTVTSAANGVPVVNIKEANANGLSHNVYETLNVAKEGVIFNNAASATNSVLGGNIVANPNLTNGTAKVILNEVVSQNASTLNGMMEVAGDAAHLIIANPNGITTKGGGFINASKATLTTGTPKLVDGALAGYNVSGGTITVGGLKSASPTEVLARSVKVIGALEVAELTAVAGNNAIDADGKVTGSVDAAGKGASYGIDVSDLGGMYANKISLISTENGMGVRNQGTIAGGTGGVSITSNGRLVNNSATIASSGHIALNANGTLENMTGNVTSEGSISIETNKNAVLNTYAGNISAVGDSFISSGVLDNTNGKLAAGNMLAVNTHGQKLINSGKSKTAGIEAGLVALETGELNNENGLIYGYYVGLKNTAVNNNFGKIDAHNDLSIESTGNVENNTGLIRSSAGAVNIKTDKVVRSNKNKSADTTSEESLGIIAGNGISITADYIYNQAALIASAKDVKLEAKGIDNFQGKIISDEFTSIKGGTLQTSQSGIVGNKGVNIDLTDTFVNRIGLVSSDYGDVSIKAKSVSNSSGILRGKNISVESQSDLDNHYSLILADEKTTVKAAGHINNSYGDKFGYYVGQYFGFMNQEGGIIGGKGVDIAAKSLDNQSSRVVAQTGDVNINLSGDMSSNNAQVVANVGNLNLKAKKLSADYSTLFSSGDLRLDVAGLSLKGNGSVDNNTASGIISADGDMAINVGGDFSNTGWISGKGNVTLTTGGVLSNEHTINAEKDLTIKATSLSNNYDIVAKNTLNITSGYDVTNSANGNITGDITNVYAKNVSNRGNLVADSQLTLDVVNNIYNYKNLYTKGKAVMRAGKIVNTGFWAVLGGAAGFQKPSYIVNIFGTVVGK